MNDKVHDDKNKLSAISSKIEHIIECSTVDFTVDTPIDQAKDKRTC